MTTGKEDPKMEEEQKDGGMTTVKEDAKMEEEGQSRLKPTVHRRGRGERADFREGEDPYVSDPDDDSVEESERWL